MADQPAPTTPAAPAAAPAAAPPPAEGAAAPPATKSPTLADLKAARRGTAPATPPLPAAATGTPAAPAAPAAAKPPDAKPGEAKIDMDPAALGQFTQMSKDVRDLRTKLKGAEDRLAGFAKMERAQALAKEGKHYDAAREAGIDVDAALAELLGKSGDPESPAGAHLVKLVERLEKIEQRDLERDKERDDRKKADAATTVERGRGLVVDYVGKNATKYPHLAKAPELVHQALQDADDVYERLKAEVGEELPDTEKNKILFDALDVHEEKWAKRFGPAAPAATGQADGGSSPGIDASSRAGVREPAPPVKKVTYEELKAERLAKRARPS